MKQWFLIENKTEYNTAVTRYEELREAIKGSDDHREKLLLAFLINQYEKKILDLPEVDPIEIIKIRMEDFDYTASDLVKAYGDKGTVSKVLNYKQPLSLTMIRLFSKLLRISPDLLTKEYKLRNNVSKSQSRPKRVRRSAKQRKSTPHRRSKSTAK